jgi:hypothetical protein
MELAGLEPATSRLPELHLPGPRCLDSPALTSGSGCVGAHTCCSPKLDPHRAGRRLDSSGRSSLARHTCSSSDVTADRAFMVVSRASTTLPFARPCSTYAIASRVWSNGNVADHLVQRVDAGGTHLEQHVTVADLGLWYVGGGESVRAVMLDDECVRGRSPRCVIASRSHVEEGRQRVGGSADRRGRGCAPGTRTLIGT